MSGCALLMSLTGLVAAPLAAQLATDQEGVGSEGPSLLLVDPDTRVESVGFRFVEGSALEPDVLASDIATTAPSSLSALRGALDFLPLVSEPELPVFSPLQLQKDVVRIRRLYEREGYPGTAVDYEVALDTAKNAVKVEFVVDQGEPLRVGEVETRWSPSGGAETAAEAGSVAEARSAAEASLPPGLRSEWRELVERLASSRGRVFGESEAGRLESMTRDWLLERGYPWAEVGVAPQDTTRGTVRVALSVSPGPRARVDGIVFEGNERLDRYALEREVPIEPGSWYEESRVVEGEAELYELDLVSRALGGVEQGQPRDSTVTLLYRISESQPRLIWWRAGWRSGAGLAGEAHWTHRDFLGGGRVVTVSALAETGWLAAEPARGRTLGLSVAVRQPYLFHHEISGTISPFVRYRNDFRDRSWLYGIETAAIYRARPLKTLTLQYELSRLQVAEAFELLSLEEVVARGPTSFSPTFLRSVFKLHGSYGRLDDRVNPRSGFVIEPSIELGGPSGLSQVEFFRLSAEAMGVIPLSRRFSLFLRGAAGRLFPFGESDPEDPAGATRAIVGLRGVMFTAGGAGDLRGWGTGLLGPKVPDVEVGPNGRVMADRYIPVGGLARVTGTVEVGMPLPFLPDAFRSFVFVDGGRVWSPGDQFQPADEELALEPWAYGTGAGLEFSSPFGPIRLSLGYKLNASRIDLLSPGEVARALAAGGELSGLSTKPLRRWHLHLTIGQTL